MSRAGGKGGACRRLPNPRLVKVHRNYSVEEVAGLLGVHKNTVREWLRRGLPAIDQQRPLLILGRDLAAYLARRRCANKQPCLPGQIFCVRCRRPQHPAGGMADYLALTASSGNLVGLCPACGSLMYRRASFLRLPQITGDLEVRLPQAQEHISDSPIPSVNCDLNKV